LTQPATQPAEAWQVRGIAAALKDPIPAVRVKALKVASSFSALAGIQPSEVVPLLRHPDPNVRISAVNALGRLGAKEQAGELVLLLRDQDSGVRASAAEALGDIQANDYAREVAKLLNDQDLYVRDSAATALAKMYAMGQVRAVADLLTSQDPGVRLSAIWALGRMHANEEVGELAKRLGDSDALVRGAAAYQLGEMQANDQAEKVAKLLNDSDPGVRKTAVWALGNLEPNAQALKLVELDLGYHPAEVLKKIYTTELATNLAHLLNVTDASVRQKAAWLLGQMGAKEQAGAVAKMLTDRDPNDRRVGVTALGDMQAKEQARAVANLLNDGDSGVRYAAAASLWHIGAKDQAGEMVKLLKDRDQMVANEAVTALEVLKAHEQVTELDRLLGYWEPNVRRRAADTLGYLGGKEEAEKVAKLLNDSDAGVRSSAVSALGNMDAKDQEENVVKLLNDLDSNVRRAALLALGMMQAKEQAQEVARMLKDPQTDVVQAALYTMEKLSPLPTSIVPYLAEGYYHNKPSEQTEIRFLCHYVTGGNQSVDLVLQRVMFDVGASPNQRPVQPTLAQARALLNAFHEILPTDAANPYFTADAESQIVEIAERWKDKWTPEDITLLSSLAKKMMKGSASHLINVIEIPWWQSVLERLWKIIAVQVLFWILLLYFYPTSTQVQAFFFWNRWARQFFGLGYVDLCLTWVPFLRARLLAPFRDELLADARVKDKNLSDYFADVQVIEIDTRIDLQQAIPEVTGQIVLEGESGLGKSTFLRLLAEKTQPPIAFLNAEDCDDGVVELIQLKLQGKAGDPLFLKSIIWSGGLRVIIDGLNEVTVETREKVRRFLDDFPKAHVLLATQPMLWKRPSRSRAVRLQRLSDDRILRFLESRYAHLATSSSLTEDEYKAKCRGYLDDILGPSQSEEDQAAARLVLSNPMDLTTAAEILARGDHPTLKNLQEQQFRKVNAEFRDKHHGQEFPIKQFSESVYQMLLRDEVAVDSDRFFEEIQVLLVHKMVAPHFDRDADGKETKKWVFRHDKIRDYFLVQAFNAERDERVRKHIDDPRFRGVYLMLAARLPVEQARELKDALVDRAAETKDHSLSDAVVEVLKTRRSATASSATG
jgi:HEAT repeat protein